MDISEYINKSKALIKKEAKNPTKIAFLSNFTITGLAETMSCLCFDEGLYVQSYTAHYNQYAQEILNKSSGLYDFKPDIVFILLDIENLLGDFIYFPYRMSAEQRKDFIIKRFDEIKTLITILKETSGSKIVINNLLIPHNSSRGILESKQEWGLKKSICLFNNLLEDLSMKDSQLFVFDINSFYLKNGYGAVCDKKMCYLGDLKISHPALIKLAFEYMGYILPLTSLSKKCIVLDLDNTLWGGIIGEDGIEGIKLGPDKQGRSFLDFQKRLLELFERGVILAINSKNNYQDAIGVLKNHKYMILKEDNFACMKINWNDKATNIREIAKEINIGLDSLVFIDDDKTNRALIKAILPEVMVVDLPGDPSLYTSVLENLQVFNLFNLTDDDLNRGKMYAEQTKRDKLKSEISDIDSFIKQLEIKIEILGSNKQVLPRVAQLTQKTNQFNLTTKRYQEEDIQAFSESSTRIVKCINVKDKFGDYGLTGVAILKKLDSECWDLDTFLLSCRILGKNIEFCFMQSIINTAKDRGVKKIRGRFIPTNKNLPAKTFLEDCGFPLIEKENGESIYLLEVGKEKIRETHVEVEEWKA